MARRKQRKIKDLSFDKTYFYETLKNASTVLIDCEVKLFLSEYNK